MLQSTIFKEKLMDYSILSHAPVFKGLQPVEIAAILEGIPHHIKRYKAGSLISQSGAPVDSLIILMSGNVKGEMVDYAGNALKLRI